MRLVEWEAKRLLAERGVPVPEGELVGDPQQARGLGGRFEQAVLKAQVLRGGRMKAGLVQFAEDERQLERGAEQIFAALSGEQAQLLVEQRLPVLQERFMAALYDPRRRGPVLLYTPHGGIEVEQEAAESIVRVPFDPRTGVPDFELRAALRRAGVCGRDLRALTDIAAALVRTFLECDATLVEINPLAEVQGRGWVALDAHVELDGDALVRHGELVERFGLLQRADGARRPSDAERAAAEIDALDHRGVAGRLVELDGDIALIVGGGGASLTVLDAITDAGGRPANYCEVGGNPSVHKVAAFTRLLLERLAPSSVAVVMNVVSNTRADLVARGVIQGCIDAGREPAQTISVFRVPGAWEQESRELLADYGIAALGRDVGIDEAARIAAATASSELRSGAALASPPAGGGGGR
jgi:succinyl-CoA synthetase beta subunit/citryl-CoA synthetase large subunit